MTTLRTRQRHRFERVIPAAPEDVWRAITDPDGLYEFPFDSAPDPDLEWLPSEPIRFVREDGTVVAEGTLVEVDEPSRLVHTYTCTAAAHADAALDPQTRVEWTLDPDADDRTRVTVLHDGFVGETATWRLVEDGWEAVLDGLAVQFDDVEEDDVEPLMELETDEVDE